MTSELPPQATCIGRQRELGELERVFDEARSGRGLLGLLSGGPGIGKTCLARAFTDKVVADGATVLWGNCWEGDGAPPFWPWIQIIRGYCRLHPPEVLAGDLGAGAADIAKLVPDMETIYPDVAVRSTEPPTPGLAPQQGRFRLFDSVATLWRNAAERAPIVIVIDDLHWADVPSLRLLHFLVRELARSRVLFLGLYREGEVLPGDPRSGPLTDVVKVSGLHRSLRGLSRTHVAALMESTAGESLHAELAAAVHKRTDGNPFYVREFTRLLVAHRAFADPDPSLIPAAGIPEGVREVVERRLARLSSEAVAALGAAAVIGHEFSVDLLGRVLGLEPLDLLERIDEAAAGRIVTESPDAPGVYAFSHGLIRDALYDLQGAGRRVDTHRRVAQALQDSPEATSRLAEIAHHYFRTTAGGDTSKAILYAELAGRQAADMFAYEDAVGHYERALVAVGSADGRRRCELLLALGDAQRRMGAAESATATFHEAVGLARRLRDATLLGRAALGVGSDLGGWGASTRTDEALTQLLEEAVGMLGDADPRLRARLLSRLAMELYWTDEVDRRRRLSDEAVRLARDVGDPTVELLALYSQYWATLSPDTLEQRLAGTDELLALASQTGNPEAAYLGHHFRATALIERGDMDAAALEIEACERLAAELRMPLYRWQTAVLQVTGTMLSGRLEQAEQQILDALATIQDADSEIAVQVFGGQMVVLRWLQGRVDELEPAIRGYLDQFGSVPAWRSALAFVYAEMGHLDEAEVIHSQLAGQDFTDLAEDGVRLITIWAHARVCAALGDGGHAEALYRVALPYAHLDVVAGPAAISLGSVSYPLAQLATAMGRWDDAQRHFEAAVARNTRTGNRPMLALALHDYSAMLLQRGTPEDRAHAARLLERALGVLDDPSLSSLAERVKALAGRVEAGQHDTDRFCRDGDMWLIEYGGRELRLKHSKGMRDLSRLLAAPGREIHVLDLMRRGAPRTVRAAEAAEAGLSTADDSGGEPILDDRARDAYRARLAELEEEITDAEDAADSERLARARAERDALAAQLTAAYGMRGRPRRAADPAERARKAVAWRLREAIRRIADVDRDLGQHLDRSVRTGTFCSYAPDTQVRWTVQG
ncbi:MAG: AAA family ATPase [Actinobacteria bacterium]|nr:AAA family ATPase [Actinomycetota bacterium]